MIHHGYRNIVCAQPSPASPTIVGRHDTQAAELYDIVAIDYDPGATRVNQENRIKLMLAVARRKEA